MTVTNYLRNPNLKAKNVPIEFTPEQIKEIIKCKNDVIYFTRNYVKIVDIDKGLVPFDLRDYQEKMIRTFDQNRFSIAMCSRQIGKSTTVLAYILHEILFNEFYSTAILAHKAETSCELLHRLKLAYEHLPLWLQQGIVRWNVGDIELENGSIVMAGSTSSGSCRGRTFRCIAVESTVTVRAKKSRRVFKDVPVSELIKVQELINTGKGDEDELYRLHLRDYESR